MANQEVKTHGVSERYQPASVLDEKFEEFRRDGYTVLEDVLTTSDLSEARGRIDAVYESQLREIGGEAQLEKIHDTDTVRAPLAYDPFFLRFVENAQVLSFVRRGLGANVSLASQVGIINRPQKGFYAYTWHRDLQYQHFVATRPLAIQTLYCIDEFTRETGGTLVLPGSHLFEEFPSENYVLRHQTQIQAKAGSALIFNAMLYHRTGENVSMQLRRAVNQFYTVPVIAQQIHFASMLKGLHSESPQLRQLLGYEWAPANSVLEWRQQRLDRGKKT